MKHLPVLLLTLLLTTGGLPPASAVQPDLVLDVWPGTPPDETGSYPPEADTTTAEANLVAGRRVLRLGNVTRPTLAVYRPPAARDTGAAVVVCPGGGHYILALDLEGTEVAQWLNTLGVTAIVLKYRVPARHPDRRWLAAVQDAQRAVRLVRHRAADWGVDPARIGILGFSAGGETAALTALFPHRQYPRQDEVDDLSSRPDFAVLVYTGGIVDRQTRKLQPQIRVNPAAPPMFLAHAYDDGVPVENSVRLFLELRNVGVPAELHVYAAGGHGYGLRETEQPVTTWHHRCADWLRASGFLDP